MNLEIESMYFNKGWDFVHALNDFKTHKVQMGL